MNLNDMGFKTPDPMHPSDLAMDSIAAQIPPSDPSENWTAVLVKGGQLMHSGTFKECLKLRDTIIKCGGHVAMFTNHAGEQ